MPAPITLFTANDAQALLDLIDKVADKLSDGVFAAHLTEEEEAAYEKLRHAGKFFIPEAREPDQPLTVTLTAPEIAFLRVCVRDSAYEGHFDDAFDINADPSLDIGALKQSLEAKGVLDATIPM